MRHLALALALAAAALAAPAGAARADKIERGVVVSIEGPNLYFDVAAGTGLAAGRPLRLKRRVALKHPVTGKPVVDELPVGAGTAQVTAVGLSLSRAEVGAALTQQARVGDIVEVLVATTAPVRPPPPRDRPPEEPLPRVDPDTAAVLGLWNATVGKPLADRIAAWEAYLERHPDSRHAELMRRDLAVLRADRDRWAAPEDAQLRVAAPVVDGVAHAAPSQAAGARPLALAFALERPGIEAAWVHFRTAGGETFRKTELRRDGDAYLRGEIPAGEVRAPGVEYFVEVATAAGEVGAAVGTAARPIAVHVEPPPTAQVFVERRRRSRVSVAATYLDFGTFDDRQDGDHTDRFYLFETDFLYRLDVGALYGVRSGFGVLNGQGGFAAAPTPGTDPERAGFNYGYTEVELRPKRFPLAFLGRGVAGLGKGGLGFGVEGRLRVGDEAGTNVTFGASTVEEIGFLSEIRMQFAAVPRVPVGLAVALTDQPNQGDLGVRMSFDLGLRAARWFSPMVRVSYQGRTVRHSGVGAGLGLVFDW